VYFHAYHRKLYLLISEQIIIGQYKQPTTPDVFLYGVFIKFVEKVKLLCVPVLLCATVKDHNNIHRHMKLLYCAAIKFRSIFAV